MTLDINSVHCGISFHTDLELSILLYADDVVLMSDSADGLQKQLTMLNNWSVKWNLRINGDKIKIVHCRKLHLRDLHTSSNKETQVLTMFQFIGI